MATIRVAKNQNYSVINNTVLNDSRLSWKAKGLAAYLLSKPDDWSIVREDLAKRSTDGVDAVRTALKELEDAGYLVRTRRQNGRGKFEWEHVLHEIPIEQAETPLVDLPPVENPSVENPPVANPSVENPRLLSTVLLSTDLPSTDQEGATGEGPLATPPLAGSAPPAPPARLEKFFTVSEPEPPPEPAPAPKVPKSADLKSLPAVKAYHDFHNRWPQNGQSKLIAEAITDIELWVRVLRAWAGRGYSPTNVQGMLDWYQNPGAMDRTKQVGNANGTHQRTKQAAGPAAQTAIERANELYPEYAYLGRGFKSDDDSSE